jgi:hypothetical protein
MIPPTALEEVTGASGVAPRIEAMLPAGVRPRQLSVRTLLAGMCLTQARQHLTGRRLDRPGNLLPAPSARGGD